jgi:SSS family solute:Na+ symporter
LHFLHTLAVVFVLTLLLLSGMSYGKQVRPRTAAVMTSTVELDLTPWKYAWLAGGLISVTTITCYIALAQ